jgi:lipid-A-disaccharide synthase
VTHAIRREPSHLVKLFFISGENSGDQPAGRLVAKIKALRPDWELVGLGGPKMEAAGMRLLRNMVNDLAIVGFVEVLTKMHKIYGVFKMVKKYLTEERPDAIVLIDYPGFNLKLVAPLAKKLGIRVIYYIVPQFWAWGHGRIAKFKMYCDMMVPILPFEEKLLRQEGIEAKYLGHPKLDLLVLTMSREEIFAHYGFDPNKKLIGIMPGSRRGEIRTLLPIMLEAAQRLLGVRDDVQFCLMPSETAPRDLIDTYLEEYEVPVTMVDRYRYNVRAALDFSWVKSGTSTLEAAFIGVPFVIIYKVNYITGWIARRLTNTPFLGLPNIIAGDLVVPELLQEQATAQNLYDQTMLFLDDRQTNENMRYQLRKIRDLFGPTGSSVRIAEALIEFLEKDRPAPVQPTEAPVLAAD